MALYAFDGTWQKDEIDDEKDTNVSRFLAAYNEPGVANHYAAGVGTKWGAIGKIFGGAALALDFANEVSKGAAAAEGREQSVLVSGGSGVGICDSTIFGHIVKSCISATSLMA